jgi:hypothetical protein
MKKKTLITTVLLICINSIYSQNWKSYFQFGVGTGYLNDADIRDSPYLMIEYGKTYKWIDIAGALEYAPEYNKYSNNTKKFISLIVKTKLDVVRMFVEDSPHSFKLGMGIGIGTTNLYHWRNVPDNNIVESNASLYYLNSVMASYEYRISEKTSLGVFFNNYTENNFFGLHNLGLSVRRDL